MADARKARVLMVERIGLINIVYFQVGRIKADFTMLSHVNLAIAD